MPDRCPRDLHEYEHWLVVDVGPWMVTADEINVDHAMGVQTRLNGETVQSGDTGQLMVWPSRASSPAPSSDPL